MPNRNQLVPIFNQSHHIDYDLNSNLSSEIYKPSAQMTLNAWQKGSLVDGMGQVWVFTDTLAQIWRTDASTANVFIEGIREHDKANFEGNNYIKYSAVIYRINELIQSPIAYKRKEYLRLSETIGITVRDSSPVENIQFKYREYIEEEKKKLKQKRINTHNISHDELTGEFLDITSAEFHHIRRQSTYPSMISLVWNGLIVNKQTHDMLTQGGVSDEVDLREVCVKNQWNTHWINIYEDNLELYNY